MEQTNLISLFLWNEILVSAGINNRNEEDPRINILIGVSEIIDLSFGKLWNRRELVIRFSLSKPIIII